MWAKTRLILASIIPSDSDMRFTPRPFLAFLLASILILTFSCKDIVFDNPLDPNASKDVVKVIRVLDTLFKGKGDIAYDGEKFWKINPYGNLTAFDRESGTTIRSFYGDPGTGLVFFLDHIYICNAQGENVLIKVDPLSGDTVNRISTRDLYPGYLAASDGLLIVYDVRSAGIFQYNPDRGDAIRLFAVPGINIGGMAIYKGGLLISDMNTDSLYLFTLSGAVLNVFASPAAGISGLAVDNSDYVYLITLDGKLYKVSLP